MILTVDDLVKVEHSPQRKRAIALARPTDAAGEVTLSIDPDFDLDKTIFRTLTSPVTRWIQSAKLSKREAWRPDVLAQIEEGFARVAASLPRHVTDDAAIYKFMATQCDFALEHADGSFMDHLHFCADYAALHMSQHSPRVLLLHSICGVGTNCFPMGKEKLPVLRTLLRLEEAAHIEAFPSVLRLIVGTPFLDHLAAASVDALCGIQSLRLHRVIDNGEMRLSGDQMWTHLNYQLIHLLDFLPPTSWQATFNEFLPQHFAVLHRLLLRAGKLEARLEFDPGWAKPLRPGSRPSSCGAWVVDRLPPSVGLKMSRAGVIGYSAACGHSLEYTIGW